ncbi:hypothetical protein D3C87_1186420 [compost metagenome]
MQRIVQVCQEVCRPSNRIGLAGASGVLNQVALAGAVFQYIGNELSRRIELVIARENDAIKLLFVVALADEITVKDVQPALAGPHLFP